MCVATKAVDDIMVRNLLSSSLTRIYSVSALLYNSSHAKRTFNGIGYDEGSL